MPSLNVDLDYFEHPKTKRLIGLLGRGAEVLPIRLWCYCGKYHSETGRLTDHAAQEIEAVIGWWGEREVCVKALERVRFLDLDSEGVYSVHDWLEHGGHIAAFKAKARVMNKVRWDNARNPASILQGVPQPTVPTDRHNQPTDRPPQPPDKNGGGVSKVLVNDAVVRRWAGARGFLVARGWAEGEATELIGKAAAQFKGALVPQLPWMADFVAIALQTLEKRLHGTCSNPIGYVLKWVTDSIKQDKAPFLATPKLREQALEEMKKLWSA